MPECNIDNKFCTGGLLSSCGSEPYRKVRMKSIKAIVKRNAKRNASLIMDCCILDARRSSCLTGHELKHLFHWNLRAGQKYRLTPDKFSRKRRCLQNCMLSSSHSLVTRGGRLRRTCAGTSQVGVLRVWSRMQNQLSGHRQRTRVESRFSADRTREREVHVLHSPQSSPVESSCPHPKK